MKLGKHTLPKLGMRTIKTALCVFICLLINFFMTTDLAVYSAIAAIVCMQSTIENTLKISVNRIVGTAIGGGAGILVILIASFSILHFLYLLIIPLGIILTIYLCNAIKMPGSSVICAIVYITVVAAPIMPHSGASDPYLLALYRITDTLIGIVVATLVNRFIAPPNFYETKNVHLVCNTYQNIYERVKHRLNGSEQLILYDTTLTEPSKKKSPGKSASSECGYSVRIPVPTEYKGEHDIQTVYISEDFTVTPMYLKQLSGYVEIPGETFPCTIVWHMDQNDKKISFLSDAK